MFKLLVVKQSIKMFKKGYEVRVSDKMQTNYSYVLSENPGENFDQGFKPGLTPKEMLEAGVFEGKYCNDCKSEFPEDWFKNAKISNEPNPKINKYGVKSRLSLQEWRKKGWIPVVEGDPDVRGWFQWYMRYYLGRRIPDVDSKQIKRWRSFARHLGQIRKNCIEAGHPKSCVCRPRQRQALLQWSYKL